VVVLQGFAERGGKMVCVPKERRTFCKGKKCKKHTTHKVTQYKAGKASNYAQVRGWACGDSDVHDDLDEYGEYSSVCTTCWECLHHMPGTHPEWMDLKPVTFGGWVGITGIPVGA
jgi:hypothetical protein